MHDALLFKEGPVPFNPLSLGTAGYFVFPTYQYNKYPTSLGKRTWTTFWDSQDIAELVAYNGALLSSPPAIEGSPVTLKPTGWAFAAHSNDPVPLLVLDIDAYETADPQRSVITAEASLELAKEHALRTYNKLLNVNPAVSGPLEPIPESIGVVLTPTGGTHFYFRLPDDINYREIPPEFNFGNGIAGEIRFSRQPRPRILMLPGSRALNKKGEIGSYHVYRPFNLEQLKAPPPHIILRLTGRDRSTLDNREDAVEASIEISRAESSYRVVPPRQTLVEAALPTEVHHFLGMLQQTQIGEGGRNNFVAAAGMIIGRIAQKRPNDIGLNLIEHVLQGALEKPLTAGEFKKAFHSGLTRGKENASHYSRADKFPSVSLVLNEFVGIFGDFPYVTRYLSADGNVDSWELGIGGSTKRKDERKRFVTMKTLDRLDVIAALSKIAGADLDVVSRSPIFTSSGWTRALILYLLAKSEDEYTSAPPLEVFWDTVLSCTIEAANEYNFGETLDSRVHGANALFLVATSKRKKGAGEVDEYGLSGGRELQLALTPLQVETMVHQSGDVVSIRKFLDAFGKRRKVYYKTGRRRAVDTWFIDVLVAGPQRFDNTLSDLVFSRFADWKQKKEQSPIPDGTEKPTA